MTGYTLEQLQAMKSPKTGGVTFDQLQAMKSTPTKNIAQTAWQQISDSFQGGVAQTSAGFERTRATNNPIVKAEGILQAGAGLVGAAFSPLAPIIEPTIGAAFNFTADKLSQVPAFQRFAANTPEGGAVERILQDIANAGTITGAAAGVKGSKAPADASLLLYKTLTQKTEAAIDNAIVKKFEKGVKPLLPSRTTPAKTRAYRDDVVSAVKTIRDNKKNLSFNDEAGGTIIGQTPRTLQELTDAVEQTKRTIFAQYDALAKQAGEAGVGVETASIASELNSVISNKALNLTNPRAVQYAQDIQTRYSQAGKLDAVTVQEVIQNYNKSLEAFYRNPSYDNASHAAIDALVANQLRRALDDGITKLTGTQYSGFKRQYGSLKAIERDVIKASLRDARKNVKGLIDFTDIFSGGQVVSGILNLNPGLVASGLTQKAIAQWIKFRNDPNRAIEQMFRAADQNPGPGLPGVIKTIKTDGNKGFVKIGGNPSTGTGLSSASTAKTTSTSKGQGGRESASAQKASTSGGFDGGTNYKAVAEMYPNGEAFYQRMPEEVRDSLRAQGIKGEEAVTTYWEKSTGKISSKGYQMTHRPHEDGPRAFDLTESEVIPKDMYQQWYGSRGMKSDLESIAALKKIKGNPEADVTIYRASPSDTFNEGDWVTFSKSYAQQHAEGQGGKVFSKLVKAKDVRWATDDINEFGYFPSKSSPSKAIPKELEPLAAEARKYKSVEEFVKNTNLDITTPPKILYKGTGSKAPNINQIVWGEHFADNINVAKEYGSTISRVDISGAKIADLDKVKTYFRITQQVANDPKAISQYLSDKGYDYARGTLPGKGYEYIKLPKTGWEQAGDWLPGEPIAWKRNLAILDDVKNGEATGKYVVAKENEGIISKKFNSIQEAQNYAESQLTDFYNKATNKK